MKKRLTEDITRYDEKMRLRFDLTTLGKIAVSVGVCALSFAVTSLLGVGFIMSFTVSLTLGIILFALLVSMIDGRCTLVYVFSMLRQFLSGEARKSYAHTDTINSGGYRISLLKEDENEDEKE